MKHLIHKYLGTSLSMAMTFIFHYIFNETRANGSLFQDVLVDPVRDHFMFVHCLFYHSIGRYRLLVDKKYFHIFR